MLEGELQQNAATNCSFGRHCYNGKRHRVKMVYTCTSASITDRRIYIYYLPEDLSLVSAIYLLDVSQISQTDRKIFAIYLRDISQIV